METAIRTGSLSYTMDKLKLIKRMVICRPKFKLSKSSCFMYELNRAGISKRELRGYFHGKCMDIYRYQGVIRSTMQVCPWCRAKQYDHESLLFHIGRVHNKTGSNLWELRMQKDLYRLLLMYVRGGNYDALSFLTQSTCQFCEKPNIDGREGMCAIPESSRNKTRSLKLLGFSCDGFSWKNYDHTHAVIIYRRRPVC